MADTAVSPSVANLARWVYQPQVDETGRFQGNSWTDWDTGQLTSSDPYASLGAFNGQTRVGDNNIMQGLNSTNNSWEDLYNTGSTRLLKSQLSPGDLDVLSPQTYGPGTSSDPMGPILDTFVKVVGALGGGATLAGAAGAGGAAASSEAAASGAGGRGLDALGTMINSVPEGMTASQYATSLGYNSADEMLAAMAPAEGAAGGYGLSMDHPSSTGLQMKTPGYYGNTPYGLQPTSDAVTGFDEGTGFGGSLSPTSISSASQPSFMDMLKNILAPSGGSSNSILGRLATQLGLPSGVANSVGPLFSIGSGVYNMMQADDLKKKSAQLAAQADPFGPYRAQYGNQLSTLMADPSSITSMPGYKAGLQAVERRGAAQGWNGSGNMMAALSDYGGNFYNNAVTQLSGLAGANIGPGTGAQIGLQGATNAASIGAQSINSIGYGLTQQSNPMTDILLRLAMNRGS